MVPYSIRFTRIKDFVVIVVSKKITTKEGAKRGRNDYEHSTVKRDSSVAPGRGADAERGCKRDWDTVSDSA